MVLRQLYREVLAVPEFYKDKICNYQLKAQPYLDAVARGVRDDAPFRSLLIQSTAFAEEYSGASPLWNEQWQRRDKSDTMKGPFWSNYYCGRHSRKNNRCECFSADAGRIESDGIFFLRNRANRVLAIHIEFKKTGEPFQPGQPEGYQLRCHVLQGRGRVDPASPSIMTG